MVRNKINPTEFMKRIAFIFVLLFAQGLVFMQQQCFAQSIDAAGFELIPNHPWKGKKVAYIGDSITDPRLKNAKTKWWGFLEDWLGLTSYVYAISGRQWNDAINQANKLKAEHGDDVDAILIFLGTNDFNEGIKIGEWFEENDEEVIAARGKRVKQPYMRKHRTPVMTNETFKGRINMALDSIKRMYPEKQIVLLTPIHRARFYANDKNWQPTEDYTNWCGEYVDAYINAVKEAGNIWAVPVIDWNASSGLYPMHEKQDYFGHDYDRLHPNENGMKRMAKTLYYQLLTLPGNF